MKIAFKPLSEQVIVVTGASSGIGLATARAAAEKGARVVLASRNGDALRKITEEITAKGGRAAYVVTDVGRAEDVDRLARAAVLQFGGFDTWVNDAGTGIFGRMEDVSHEDSRRLFDTNFWGVVYGSLAAVRHLKERGGALVNLGSVASDNAAPGLGMYSASKHAVKGFTDSLRLEMAEGGYPVSVTLVKPAAVATPFFEHAKNYTEEPQDAPAPVYAPEEVAKAILYAAEHRVPTVNVGGAGHAASALQTLAPSLMGWLAAKTKGKEEKPRPVRHNNDNLHRPGDDGQVRGEGARKGQISLYTRSQIHPVMTGLTVAALAGAAAVLAGRAQATPLDRARRSLRKRF